MVQLYSGVIAGYILESNGFLVPQWGSILIDNPDASASRVHYNATALHPVMEFFVEQLRQLLGVKPTSLRKGNELLVLLHLKLLTIARRSPSYN
jgi:hypothetical protein